VPPRRFCERRRNQVKGLKRNYSRLVPVTRISLAQLLLDTVANHRWAVVYRVALELGLRRGEILALRWADIDFERMVLAVTGTMPEIRFHDLRHSCASILLAQNVHPRVIMEILGHSEIGTTMNLYAHVIPEVQESAMQLLSQALAPKAKLAQIEYTRYDAESTLIDSGTLEREGELALMARLSPKGWTLSARLIAQDGQVEERVYLCGRVE
jgi:integrase